MAPPKGLPTADDACRGQRAERTYSAFGPPALRLVIDVLRDTPDELTANDVAAQLGLSRPTAQRYLADLVEDGLATVTMRYGTAGRPEHRYHWRTTP